VGCEIFVNKFTIIFKNLYLVTPHPQSLSLKGREKIIKLIEFSVSLPIQGEGCEFFAEQI